MVYCLILSNAFYVTQPTYQYQHRSNCNTPSESSDQQSENKNLDCEIKV